MVIPWEVVAVIGGLVGVIVLLLIVLAIVWGSRCYWRGSDNDGWIDEAEWWRERFKEWTSEDPPKDESETEAA